jgi:hypothetical protein
VADAESSATFVSPFSEFLFKRVRALTKRKVNRVYVPNLKFARQFSCRVCRALVPFDAFQNRILKAEEDAKAGKQLNADQQVGILSASVDTRPTCSP